MLPAGSGLQLVDLAGIGAGPLETGQVLAVSAVSDTPALVPHPMVTYTSPAATALLTFQPVAGQTGVATITVTVSDDGGSANGGVASVARTFAITITPAGDLVFANGFEAN